jgi:hemerythrin-like domain-containing protein
MRYSEPMQILVDEHEIILSVLDAVEAVLVRADSACPVRFFEKALDFFATFGDKCHHAKEEVYLFPLLEARGIPREQGPIGCMLHEHEEGRARLAAVRQALPNADRDPLAARIVHDELSGYVFLLRQHIDKENQILFPAGDHQLTTADKEVLGHKFSCAEHSVLPPGSHQHYLDLAAELANEAGTEAGRAVA